MKKIKSIYTFFIALLLGFFSFACSDEDMEQSEGNSSDDNSRVTEIEINIGAPDVSAELETRVGAERATITVPKPENGGKFQNLVVVLADKSNKVYGIKCEKWYDDNGPSESVGETVKSLKFVSSGLTQDKARVYALGNISAEAYDIISTYGVSDPKAITLMPELKKLLNASISTDDLYNLNFTSKTGRYKIDGSNITTCAGMPLNGMATAVINSEGRMVFNVKMKRVCARMKVKFINATDYYNYNPNSIYIDSFRIKNLLAKSSKYFYDGSTFAKAETEDFDILKALRCTNDHINNKVERPWSGSDSLVVSMYVFESLNGNYTYDLKVDKGKVFGKDTKYIEDGNAYVILHTDNRQALAYNKGWDNRICTKNDQGGSNAFLGFEQIFWEIKKGSQSAGTYALKHYPVNEQDLYDKTLDDNVDVYMGKQGTSGFKMESATSDPSEIQYVALEPKSGGLTQILFCASKDDINHQLDGKQWYGLVIDRNKFLDILSTAKSKKGYFDWAFYSKYIIRRGEPLQEDKDGQKVDVAKIARNNNYELTFNISTNKEAETFLYVKSGDGNNITYREQKEITDWEVTQK